jgi:hypothetical protein
MIEIYTQNNFIFEKEYLFDFVFRQQLGIDYCINFHNFNTYKLVSHDGKKIIFEDVFFSLLNQGSNYFSNSRNLPQLSFAEVDNFPHDIAVLYGKNDYSENDDEIYCGIDIFAGIFFFLTRWEEISLIPKDKFLRINEQELFSVKNNIHKRPVVDEYVELLKNFIQKKFSFNNFNSRVFKSYITHDIDYLFRYDNFIKFLKALGGDIVKRKSLTDFFTSLRDYYNYNFRKLPDVWDTFDYLMDLSEKKSIVSRFYFIAGKKGEFDVRFDIDDTKCIQILQKILARNHIVGIHPSYSSFNNENQLKLEISRLQQYVNKVEEGRQHYLRFSIPETWNIWEKSGLKIDSSLGFYSLTGFRCGTCMEYKVFDVIQRKMLNLTERPLIIMDTALKRESKNDKNSAINISLDLLNIVKRFNGDFVLLWHNNNLQINEWKGWGRVYEEILNNI